MIDPMPSILFVTTLYSTDTPAGAPGGTHVRDANKWILAASAVPVYYPLTGLQDGDVFMWQLDVEKNTNGSATITGKVVYTTISGETDAETAVTDNSNAPGAINFSNSTKITVVDGRMYYFKFIPSASVTPAADRIGILKVKYRRFGANAHAMATCTSRAGRLISLAVTSANGSHTANTGRLTLNNAYQNNYGIGNLYYLADVSTVAETTGTPKTNGLTMATIESNAKFIAGPTITGNGTHSPPIWTNGKRCYDESLNIGSGVTTPYKLGIRFESSTGIDLFDTTFYVAEGI
jgi:hypothetical protein